MSGKITIGVTHGLRGFFAFVHDDIEPIQSSPFSFETSEEAWKDAEQWSKAEEIPLDFKSIPSPR